MEDIRRQEKEERMFRREELLGRFTVKKLFGWTDKRYNEEYQRKLEKNWKRQKGSQQKRNRSERRRTTLETIKKSSRKIQG